jgi:segregation and condensation protein A
MTGSTIQAIPRPRDLAGAEPFVVDLERFSGPLDLLLHLIRSQDIDIFDIPISRITDQFQAALDEGMEQLDLDKAGEFLEMAATLVRIKAQLLLPRSGEIEWDEDPRAELVRRLLEYEHFREISHVLSSAEGDRSRHFGKGHVEPRVVREDFEREIDVGIVDFMEVARRALERAASRIHRAPMRGVSVAEKIALVRQLLRKGKRLAFTKLFEPWGTRQHAVAALLASLELARRQVIRLEQVRAFGTIFLLRGKRVTEIVEEEK